MATSAVQRGAPAIGPAPRGGRWLVVATGVVAALLPIVGYFTRELFDYGSRVEIDPPDDDDAIDMTDEAAEGLQTW
jgi:hypothetical protein